MENIDVFRERADKIPMKTIYMSSLVRSGTINSTRGGMFNSHLNSARALIKYDERKYSTGVEHRLTLAHKLATASGYITLLRISETLTYVSISDLRAVIVDYRYELAVKDGDYVNKNDVIAYLKGEREFNLWINARVKFSNDPMLGQDPFRISKRFANKISYKVYIEHTLDLDGDELKIFPKLHDTVGAVIMTKRKITGCPHIDNYKGILSTDKKVYNRYGKGKVVDVTMPTSTPLGMSFKESMKKVQAFRGIPWFAEHVERSKSSTDTIKVVVEHQYKGGVGLKLTTPDGGKGMVSEIVDTDEYDINVYNGTTVNRIIGSRLSEPTIAGCIDYHGQKIKNRLKNGYTESDVREAFSLITKLASIVSPDVLHLYENATYEEMRDEIEKVINGGHDDFYNGLSFISPIDNLRECNLICVIKKLKSSGLLTDDCWLSIPVMVLDKNSTDNIGSGLGDMNRFGSPIKNRTASGAAPYSSIPVKFLPEAETQLLSTLGEDLITRLMAETLDLGVAKRLSDSLLRGGKIPDTLGPIDYNNSLIKLLDRTIYSGSGLIIEREEDKTDIPDYTESFEEGKELLRAMGVDKDIII